MQDASGHIYWSLATKSALLPEAVRELAWDATRRCAHLQESAAPVMGNGTRAWARTRAARPSWTVDRYGTRARVSESGTRVLASRVDEDEHEIWQTPGEALILDMAWTQNGHLIVATALEGGESAKVYWVDLLDRFDMVELSEPDLKIDRVCTHALSDTVWLVDRAGRQARVLSGTPIPDVLDTLPRSASVFAPKPEMADPPRLDTPVLSALAGSEIIDAACDETGALLLLRWPAGLVPAVLERIAATGETASHALDGAVLPHTMAPMGEGRVALGVRDWPEARAYRVPDFEDSAGLALPLGLRLPLRDWAQARFCTGATRHAYYRSTGLDRQLRRLVPVSFAAYTSWGEVSLGLIDSGQEGFVWHKLCVDAILPVDARLQVLVSASDQPEGPPKFSTHTFGTPSRRGVQGVWLAQDSERPWLASPLDCASQKGRAGLFSCALQKEDGDNKRITGRYLRLKLRFKGGGTATPRLFALRAYGNRFSWRDRFLPELFTINDGPGAAGSDFLDRFLTLFEGMLTQTEGDIAKAYRLANPLTIPAEGLDWLAQWMGVVPDGALGEGGKRRLIAEAAKLAPWRGTLRGLTGMLDIASGGGVADGRVVVVEHFKMRRTFATILGANLDDQFDPLTRGTRQNANSHLGAGFFLGAEDEKRLFALFGPELLNHDLTSRQERHLALAQLDDLLDGAAHRVTVLVHDETDPDRRGLISRVIRREKPAHVIADLYDAPSSMILGLTALLGVETRTSPAPHIPGLTLGTSAIGQSRLRGTPALDNRI
ncbi:MAG: phage tail protein [Aliishimia sp.]